MSDTIRFREGSPADRDAVLALRALVFAREDVEKQRADFWDWEFSHGYAGEGVFFVAETEGRLAGHFAFVPQRYVTPFGPVNGALAVDVMVHPRDRRRGVFSRLAKFAASRLADRFPLVAAFQVRKEVLGGMLAGGWQPVQSLPVLLKPLSLRGIASDLGLPVRGPRVRRTASPNVRTLEPEDLGTLRAMLDVQAVHQPRSR
jgi:GNAT superfamily N-acetyltransferase